MISIPLRIRLLLLIFAIFPFSVNAQNTEIDVFTTVFMNDDDDPFFEGNIELKNGDVLYGKVSINKSIYGNYMAIYNSDSETRYIPNHTIAQVFLKNKRGEATKFIAINDDGKLYRSVFSNTSNTTIYDTSKKPFDNRLVGEVIIESNGVYESIFNFWSSGPKQDLINYLKKRDGIAYKRRDFKSIQQLFAAL